MILLIRSSTIGSKTNPSGAIVPSCGIGVLLNLSISRGLMPTLFRRTIHGEYTEHTDNIATVRSVEVGFGRKEREMKTVEK